MIEVNIVNTSNNPNPEYKTDGAVGMDLMASLNEPIVLKPFERALIPTGIFIGLPEGYEAQVRPRSGLALKYGITVLNTPGTIDADYTGEVKVILINLGQVPFTIKNGDRIAQMVFKQYEKAVWFNTLQLGETERGDGGFGHTGV